LITAGAGGLGLNITAANTVFLTEVWRNKNSEKQAISRVYRQGQESNVWCVRFQADNSEIDSELVKVQERKDLTNRDILEPLIRPHNRRPRLPPILTLPPLDPPLDAQRRIEELQGTRKGKKRIRVDQDNDNSDDEEGSISSGGGAGEVEVEYKDCYGCGKDEEGTGLSLVCDTIFPDGTLCPETIHLTCVGLEAVPEGRFFCDRCIQWMKEGGK
jgi:hypothetical protein